MPSASTENSYARPPVFRDRRDVRITSFLRGRRFAFFLKLLKEVKRPLTILDVGGHEWYWKQAGWRGQEGVRLVLLNLQPFETDLPNATSVVGDATDLSDYSDHQFDVVFSNSVIEHVGDWRDQTRMAREVARVGKRYFVQTPNRWFPIEPHFLLPFFQFYPRQLRVLLISRLSLGHMRRASDRSDALAIADSVRLLTLREFRRLFPEADIRRERILGLTKSFIAYAGW
jgi:SAM-dependent methyltransferase